MLLALIFWPLAAILRKHYGRPMSLAPKPRRLRLLVRIVCLFYLLFFVDFGVFIAMGLKDIGLLSARGIPWLHLIQQHIFHAMLLSRSGKGASEHSNALARLF